MLFGLHLLASEYLLDDTLLIDNKRGADSAHGLLAIHRFLAPGSHGLKQLVIDICNQWERQFILILKLHMRGSRVLAHANHLVTLAL